MERAADRILVVDDEPALLKMVSIYLSRMGYTVVTSANPESGWNSFVAAPDDFAVAVLDGSIAGLNCDGLAGRMLLAGSRLCVIVSSGYPLDMTAVDAVAPGRAVFLQKPFTSDMLQAAVRGLLAAQEKRI